MKVYTFVFKIQDGKILCMKKDTIKFKGPDVFHFLLFVELVAYKWVLVRQV